MTIAAYFRHKGFRSILISLSVIIICVIVFEYWLVNPPGEISNSSAWISKQLGRENENAGKMCILMYNNGVGHLKKGKDVFDFTACNMSSVCRVSTDNSDAQTCKLVIFNHVTIPRHPPVKGKSQWWMFTSSESPLGTVNTYKLPQWKGKFDMVMNYRRDAHFFFGYGDIINRNKELNKNYDQIYDQKDREVAWIVSHCVTLSKREDYIKEMRKYINVDIFGNCGNRTACKSYNGYEDDNCHNMVGKRYKFYLSFENVLCKSYTTEKLYFAYAFDKNVIPVVRGAFDSKDYLPKDGAIFSEDFQSPKELALFMKELGSDKKRYIEFLRRKDKYAAKTSPQTLDDSFCTMCHTFKTIDENQRKPFDLQEWMLKDTCREPNDLVIS